MFFSKNHEIFVTNPKKIKEGWQQHFLLPNIKLMHKVSKTLFALAETNQSLCSICSICLLISLFILLISSQPFFSASHVQISYLHIPHNWCGYHTHTLVHASTHTQTGIHWYYKQVCTDRSRTLAPRVEQPRCTAKSRGCGKHSSRLVSLSGWSRCN